LSFDVGVLYFVVAATRHRCLGNVFVSDFPKQCNDDIDVYEARGPPALAIRGYEYAVKSVICRGGEYANPAMDDLIA
jgi:hypothetical protein